MYGHLGDGDMRAPPRRKKLCAAASLLLLLASPRGPPRCRAFGSRAAVPATGTGGARGTAAVGVGTTTRTRRERGGTTFAAAIMASSAPGSGDDGRCGNAADGPAPDDGFRVGFLSDVEGNWEYFL